MKIAVIGTGYVGLVSGVGLAGVGHDVLCVDMREDIVATLGSGVPTIYEAGLDRALSDALAAGRIRFSLPDIDALASSDVILIAVGTPSKNGDIDLSHIEGAARTAGQAVARADHPITVLVKSTVVPGTTRGLVLQTVLAESGKPREAFGIGMNPEFLREGSAVADFTDPDRIVFGAEDDIARGALREMYASFDVPKIEVNTTSAELIKYANNMFLALLISASNEVADVAAALGDVDPVGVMEGVMADRRWGGSSIPPISRYMLPGPGFGGSCFPKDVEALREFGRGHGVAMDVSAAILDVNGRQPEFAMSSMLADVDVRGRTVLVLGLAFKTDTDDVRETPALGIVRYLLDREAHVLAHDPMAVDAFGRLIDAEITYVDDWQAAVAQADVVVVPTPWREYAVLPSLLSGEQVVVDPRRAYAPDGLPEGVGYRSLGVSA